MPADRIMVLSMLVLMVWTALTLLLLAFKRITGVRAQRVDPHYYELFRGGQEPDDIAVVARHFHNLLEMPPLFYAVVLAIIALGQADLGFAVLAVLYTTVRLLHAAVHLTTNIVEARFGLYFLSVAVQTTMAVRLGMHLLAAS